MAHSGQSLVSMLPLEDWLSDTKECINWTGDALGYKLYNISVLSESIIQKACSHSNNTNSQIQCLLIWSFQSLKNADEDNVNKDEAVKQDPSPLMEERKSPATKKEDKVRDGGNLGCSLYTVHLPMQHDVLRRGQSWQNSLIS